jgi:hypothetical protein
MIPTTSTDRISNSALPVWVFNEQNFFASQFACDTVGTAPITTAIGEQFASLAAAILRRSNIWSFMSG